MKDCRDCKYYEPWEEEGYCNKYKASVAFPKEGYCNDSSI